MKDGNDYAESTEASEPLIALARRTNAHLLFTHHAKKGDSELIDALLGSTAIAAAVDTVLLERRYPDKRRTLESNQRVGDDLDETLLTLDKATGTLYLAGTLEEARMGDDINHILSLLARDGPLTEKAIRDGAGVKVQRTVAALRAAVLQGTVRRLGEGKANDPYRYLYLSNNQREQGKDRNRGNTGNSGDPGNYWNEGNDPNQMSRSLVSLFPGVDGGAEPPTPSEPDRLAEACYGCDVRNVVAHSSDGRGWCLSCWNERCAK